FSSRRPALLRKLPRMRAIKRWQANAGGILACWFYGASVGGGPFVSFWCKGLLDDCRQSQFFL
ncbi:hypothetical protein, partial [Pseudomonas protegens]|uniref:hypothetical protein n=1 Tax=Pseudomonas protegens TaxID=380021 RepID=UPI001C82F392